MNKPTEHSAQQSPVIGLLTALGGFALYSTHDALTKYVGAGYSVFQIIFFAMLFAFVPMSIMMLADKQVRNFRPKKPGLVLLRSVTMIIGLSCAFYAFTALPLAEVYSLLFAAPLLITVFSIPILGEVVRGQRWAAVIVGLIGVLIVLRPGASEFTLGHAAGIISACCSAFSSVLVRKIGREERTAVMILFPMILAMIVMGMLLPSTYKPMELIDLALVACIGLFSVFAQFAVIAGYRRAPAAVIAPAQYSQIIWATIFGVLFFEESPDIYVGIGSAIIIGSGVFVVWRESRSNVSARYPVLRTLTTRLAIAPTVRRPLNPGEKHTSPPPAL